MGTVTVGPLVREWRTRRRRSQLDVALDVGMSARHLSFVETGRSRPSPELLLAIATKLDVPLRERNDLLLAAGYAPRYRRTDVGDPALAAERASIQRMLDAHEPYPGVVLDRLWNVVLANRSAGALLAGLPSAVLGPPLNVHRLCLHPDGLAPVTLNFGQWAGYLLGQLRRSLSLTGDPALRDLLAEVSAYPTVLALNGTELEEDPPILVPWRVRLGEHELALFTTLTTFATPRDVTLDELAVELFFPADDTTARLLQAGASPPTPSPSRAASAGSPAGPAG